MVGDKPTKNFAFVIPRCTANLAGGAETLVFQLAKKIGQSNNTEILTTCAIDNRTWENYFEPGASCEKGVFIKRFLVNSRDLDTWTPLQVRLSQGLRLSHKEELQWIENSVNSYDLYAYLKNNAKNYDAIFFAPYLFGTTFWGSLIEPKKSILIPCLHDEAYAYTNVIASMFRLTKGCLFNSDPEKHLAQSLYGPIKGGEVGMGFDNFEYVELTKPDYLSNNYILYLGRKETGKNIHLLIDYFVESKENSLIDSNLSLVVMGAGDFADSQRAPVLSRGDIIDLTHQDELTKQAIIQNSICLVQPSLNESFSIVLMEAWLQKVPVLVHARCAVTKYHVQEANGGLYFGSMVEFSEAINLLCKNQDLNKKMGQLGFNYVKHKYNWDLVLNRFEQVTSNILSL